MCFLFYGFVLTYRLYTNSYMYIGIMDFLPCIGYIKVATRFVTPERKRRRKRPKESFIFIKNIIASVQPMSTFFLVIKKIDENYVILCTLYTHKPEIDY